MTVYLIGARFNETVNYHRLIYRCEKAAIGYSGGLILPRFDAEN
jgi:hypothetical protein